jgi:hypothetical protein
MTGNKYSVIASRATSIGSAGRAPDEDKNIVKFRYIDDLIIISLPSGASRIKILSR